MPFNTFEYLLFLPVVFLLFYYVGQRARWIVLLAASVFFYAALKVPYLLLVLIVVVVITYVFGLFIKRVSVPKAKLLLLWGGIGTNVVILAVMKYLPYLSTSLQAWAALFSVDAQIQPIKVIVSIGVSYYVFQAISYLIDIYLDLIKPEQHFGYFALSIAFFPKLLQGPIERMDNFIPQLKAKYEFNYDNMRFGLLLFTWGLFKKIVIADRLGLYVDYVYNDVHSFTGLPLLLATYCYAFQILMDFSGYTDMALGSARIFNINLTQNFNSPYLALTVSDFWRRWHISFSRWILDYIFKPLQMQWRKLNNWGSAAALIVTFLVSGVWHGASWGFVIWGLLHGLYLATSVFFKPYQKRMYKFLRLEKTFALKLWQMFITFHLVCFAWIFFRTARLEDAIYIISNMSSGVRGSLSGFLFSQNKTNFLVILVSVILFTVISSQINNLRSFFLRNSLFRWAIYYGLIFYIIIFAQTGKATFIYLGF